MVQQGLAITHGAAPGAEVGHDSHSALTAPLG